MDTAVAAYFAGLLDGEGTIGLEKPTGTEFLQPFVSISSTTPELTNWLLVHFGGKISYRKGRKVNHSDAYVWTLRGRKALDALRMARPFVLESHKRAKLALLVDRYLEVTPRNGRYTEEQARLKRHLQEEFKAIGSSRDCLTRGQ